MDAGLFIIWTYISVCFTIYEGNHWMSHRTANCIQIQSLPETDYS